MLFFLAFFKKIIFFQNSNIILGGNTTVKSNNIQPGSVTTGPNGENVIEQQHVHYHLPNAGMDQPVELVAPRPKGVREGMSEYVSKLGMNYFFSILLKFT